MSDHDDDVIVKVTVERGDALVTTQCTLNRDRGCAQLWQDVVAGLSVLTHDEKNEVILSLLSLDVAVDAKAKYDACVVGERFHITLVRNVMKILGHLSCRHDFTKDAYYVFILCGRYGGVNCQGQPFDAEFSSEVNRHFSLERHHPEYEKFNGVQVTDDDILETAVDRLARSVVKNNGEVNWEEMLKYLPHFFIGDVDRKLKFYQEKEKEVAGLVVAEYKRLKVDTGTHLSEINDAEAQLMFHVEVTPNGASGVIIGAKRV